MIVEVDRNGESELVIGEWEFPEVVDFTFEPDDAGATIFDYMRGPERTRLNATIQGTWDAGHMTFIKDLAAWFAHRDRKDQEQRDAQLGLPAPKPALDE